MERLKKGMLEDLPAKFRFALVSDLGEASLLTQSVILLPAKWRLFHYV